MARAFAHAHERLPRGVDDVEVALDRPPQNFLRERSARNRDEGRPHRVELPRFERGRGVDDRGVDFARDLGELAPVHFLDRGHLERQIVRLGKGREPAQERARRGVGGRDRQRRRGLRRADDRDRQLVDGAKQELAQQIEILRLVDPARRALDVVGAHDPAGPQS
jgi:hypothetical protein